jgi:hypothetical protein
MRSEVEVTCKTGVNYVKCLCFEVQWSEESYSVVLGDNSGTLLRALEYIMTISFVCVLYCGYFNFMCLVIRVCEFL